MYLFRTIALLVFPIAGFTNPLQVTLSCSGDRDDIGPAWKKENEQLIVPLIDIARKGDVDPAVEEGLIATLGTRFVNALYTKNVSDDVSGSASFPCITKCGSTVLKAVPCLLTAARKRDINAVLKCVSKDKLCSCASCLPDVVEEFVKTQICKPSVIDTVAEEDKKSPYVDYSSLSDNSVIIQAFRGELYDYQVEQLQRLNREGSSASSNINNFANDCVIGSSCGGCNCCVGGCFLDKCIGICA